MTHHVSRRRVLAVTGTAAGLALAGCIDSGRDSPAGSTGEARDGDGGTPGDATGETGDATGELGDPDDHVEVRLQSVPEPLVDPGLVHVTVGGTVEWVAGGLRNTTTAYHPETNSPQRIPDGAEPWDSGLLRDGSRFTVTFDREGIYDYADTVQTCGSHEAFGVVGRVVVGQPTLAGQPAYEHDVEELPSLATDAMASFDRQCESVLDRQ